MSALSKTIINSLLAADTTQSTNSSTGSIVTSGGVGIAKDLFVGGSVTATSLNGTLQISNVSGLQGALDAKVGSSNFTVKGDILVGTGNGTYTTLPSSGTNGQVLTVDTSTSTGLSYAAPSSGGLWLTFNPAFDTSTGLYNYSLSTSHRGEYYTDINGATHVHISMLVTGTSMTGATGTILFNLSNSGLPSMTGNSLGQNLFGSGFGFLNENTTFLKGFFGSVYYSSSTKIGLYAQTYDLSAPSTGTTFIMEYFFRYK